MPELVHIYR